VVTEFRVATPPPQVFLFFFNPLSCPAERTSLFWSPSLQVFLFVGPLVVFQWARSSEDVTAVQGGGTSRPRDLIRRACGGESCRRHHLGYHLFVLFFLTVFLVVMGLYLFLGS